MSDDPPLRPATRDEILHTLSYGLRFNTYGKPHRLAADPMVDIAADILVSHLERSGFVVMKRPARPQGPAPNYDIPGRDPG